MLDAPSIAGRPQLVDERRRYGDWEGDTNVGAQYSGVIVTAVERKSGYLRARLACDRPAWRVREKLEQMLGPLTVELRRTITCDNGKQFADHERLKRRTGIRGFFAEPCKSWQRVELSRVNHPLSQLSEPAGHRGGRFRHPRFEPPHEKLHQRAGQRLRSQLQVAFDVTIGRSILQQPCETLHQIIPQADDRLLEGRRAPQGKDKLTLLGDVLEQDGHVEQARGVFIGPASVTRAVPSIA